MSRHATFPEKSVGSERELLEAEAQDTECGWQFRGWRELGIGLFWATMRTVIFWLAMGLPAMAAEYFVATSGADTNAGSAAAPWRTIQKAANTVAPGDTVNVVAGVYAERVTISGKRGTAVQPIVFRTRPGDSMAVLDQTGVTPPAGSSAVLSMVDSDQVTIQNLEIRNYKTTSDTRIPMGIWVRGAGNGVRIVSCKVHDIWQSNATVGNFNANGFGILVAGDAAQPIQDLVIDGCEVYGLRTGASESVAINGNVSGIQVTNNRVHDCNNIGIDFIGFEGTAPAGTMDQARNALCSGNTVWNIDSRFNPAYGGNFDAGGSDSTRSAPGLYVDGGRDVVMERNHVYACNFGVSIGSEHFGRVSSHVILRNNLIHHCHVGGVVLGGSDPTQNGGATGCSVLHNTLYENDTTGFGGGQVSIQNFVGSTTLRHNLMVCNSSTAQFVLKDNTTGSFSPNDIDWNLYSGASATAVEFIWDGTSRATFAAWRTDSLQDANSFFAATPGLVGPSLNALAPAANFKLTASSAALNAGNPAFVPQPSERDLEGQSRVVGGLVDIGCDEWLSPWQAWRDSYFSLPDGGPGAEPMDDPDADGVTNFMEYALGSSPVSGGASRLPVVTRAGAGYRFSYRKDGAGLVYGVEKSTMPGGGWVPVVEAEQTDGNGNFWRDVPLSAPLFMRLKVAWP